MLYRDVSRCIKTPFFWKRFSFIHKTRWQSEVCSHASSSFVWRIFRFVRDDILSYWSHWRGFVLNKKLKSLQVMGYMMRFTFGQITFITVCAFPSFPELHFKPFDFGLWISSAFKVCSLHHFNCVLLRAIDPRDCCTASAFRCISPVFDAISNAYDMCPKVKHSQPSRLLHSKCIPQVCLPTSCMHLYIYIYICII